MKRFFPIGNKLLDWSKRTHVMGMLNLTPDSFSDGGHYVSVEDAMTRVRLMISEGTDMIDIGAQSTRPGANNISMDEDFSQIFPILEAMTQIPKAQDKILSMDTFDVKVTYATVNNGFYVVNDVFGAIQKLFYYSAKTSSSDSFIEVHSPDEEVVIALGIREITKLGPHALLSALKEIEKDLGETKGIRYGPHPIYLDIIFYGRLKVASDTLRIPHQNVWERPFVLSPLFDLLGLEAKDDTVACWHTFSGRGGSIFRAWENLR
ncbi:hypothetical protein KI387_002143, partial [Taxus chinensis]